MNSCLQCGIAVSIPKDVLLGEVLDCADCGIELAVKELSPIEFQILEPTDEDWGE